MVASVLASSLLGLGLTGSITAVVLGVSQAAATADTATATDYGAGLLRGLAEDSHSHVYIVSNGFGVDVRDESGAAVTTLNAGDDINAYALTPDRSRLVLGIGGYNPGRILEYDTSTLQKVLDVALPSGACVTSLAATDNRVWYADPCAANPGTVDVLDTSQDPAVITQDFVNVGCGVQEMFVSPAAGQRVGLYCSDSSGRSLMTLDPATGAVTGPSTVSGGPQDFHFTADGSQIEAASMTTAAVVRWSSSTLAAQPSLLPGVAADVLSTASGFFATGVDSAASTPDLRVYTSTGSLVRSWEFSTCCTSTTYDRLVVRGALFSADRTRLFAVTSGKFSSAMFRVLLAPTRYPTTLALTPPTAAARNVSYAIKGRLSSALAIPGGRVLSVRRSSSYGVVTRPNVTTASDGTFTITDKVAYRGWYSYAVAWAGDASHQSVAKTVSVYVKGASTSVSIALSTSAVTYGATITATGHLGSGPAARVLSIYAKPGGGSKVLLKKATVDSSGNVKVSYKPTVKTVLTATFAGDSIYEPVSASKSESVRIIMSTRLTGYYATSGIYRLVHNNTDPEFGADLKPIRGGCLVGTMQQLTSGVWKTVVTNSCVGIYSTYSPNLDTGSAYCYPTATPRVGYFRVRYVYPSNSYYIGATGAWQYFHYTS